MRLSAALLALMLTACQSAGGGGIQKEDRQERLQRAEALFRERCKTSGEFIKRTVDNVEGIYLLKVRSGKMNYGDQFAMDDPYGRDLRGDGYIQSFLRGFWDDARPVDPTPSTPPRIAYRYVEAIDPADGKRYRYTGGIKVVGRKDETAPNVKLNLAQNPAYDLNLYAFVLDKTPALGDPPGYGVTYDDISTREERELWIAGSSLKVIDLKSNEVIAERIGYMLDRGQGNTSGGRSPWLLAANNACPVFSARHGATAQQGQTEMFVEKVLRPKIGR